MDNTNVLQGLQEIRDLISKAAEVKTTYTFDPASRSVFSPENLDEKIKYMTPVDAPLRQRIPRVAGKGEAAVWKKMTSGLHSKSHSSNYAVAGTGTSIAFADAGAPNETAQTYSTATAVYKLLGRKLEVGGGALASSKGRAGEADQMTDRERIKMNELILGEEELLIMGDSAFNANEFDGLLKQITTYSGSATFLTASGVGDVAQKMYANGGDPTLLYTNARQLQALADSLQRTDSIFQVAIPSGQTQGSVIGGIALKQIVNPVTSALIDVKPSRYIGANALLLTERSVAGEVWIESEELIPVSRVDVASSNFSYISFVIEMMALKLIGEPFQYKIALGV